MRLVVWLAVFSTCLLGVTVDSVVIRDYRLKAKLTPGSSTDEDGKDVSEKTQRQRSRRKTFRPNPTRCCKIGYKVAKRKLSCDVRVLEVVRKYNDLQRAKMKYNRPRKIRPSKISAKLSVKLGKCSANMPQYFEKCCKYRDQYYKRLAKCKQRPRRERRKCRQYVRKRSKAPKGGKRGEGRKRQARAKVDRAKQRA